MATDNTQAFFGGNMLPEELQQQLTRQRASEFAQLTPSQQLAQAQYTMSANAGQGLAKAMGVDIQDPAIKRMSQLQALRQGIVPNAEGLKVFAQRLADAGFTTEAVQAMDKAVAMEKEQGAATKTSQEVLGIQSRAKTLMDDGVPEAKARAVASSEKAFSEYMASKKIATPSDYAVAAGAAGIPVKPFLSDYTPEEIRQMEKGVFAHKAGISAAGRTTIINQQEGELTKSNVNAFGMLRDQAVTSGKTLEAVQAIIPLIDKAFTGFGANQKLSAGQLADTFGVPVSGTSETEQLKSLQNNLKIGNSTVLKGSLSDKDMAILGEAIGQGNTTASGIKSIINNIKKDALISQRQYQKANEYQQQGKLSQYDFVKGSNEARDEVSKDLEAKMKRLKELEAKASKGQ